MNIIIVNYLKLNELPPAISLLEKINENKGIYISLYNEEEYKRRYKNIRFYSLYNKEEKFTGANNLREKIKYKKAEFLKNIATNRITGLIDRYYDEDTIVWFLHESTVLALNKKIKKYSNYYVTLYELDAAQNDRSGKLSKICKNAKKVIVPEETRAHIIKAFLDLEKKPYVIHNKPYMHHMHIDASRKNKEITRILDQFNQWKNEGKKIFIYAGIFLPERKLDTIISAFNSIENAKLVLMGRNSYYLEQLRKDYPDVFEYVGFFPSPEHLNIIRIADVGILTYIAKNRSINAIFCAPNKIFEYGAFGLPVIGNDIPGLKYTIEGQNIGNCFDQDNEESIKIAITKTLQKYDEYKKNILKYVESVSVNNEIEMVLNRK